MTTGDALSVRTKFCFLTWIGEKGGPLAKARAGPNKRILQQVITVSTDSQYKLNVGIGRNASEHFGMKSLNIT